MLGIQNYHKPLPEPPYPFSLDLCESHEDSLKFLQWEERINKQIENPQFDTIDIVLAFSDTLIFPDRYEIENIENKIQYLKSYIPDYLDDSVVKPLMSFLIDSTKYKARQIDLKKIENTGRYRLKEINQFREQYPRYKNFKGFRFVGDLMFSRIIFNNNKTEAVFYENYICGGECGSGDIVWIEKVNNKWKIKHKINLWES